VIITATHYVALSLILFCLGLVGVMVRRNFITVLMSLELMFNAVNLNLIAFSYRLDDLAGQVLAIFVITVAAAEAAIGLGLIIALVRLKDTVSLDEVDVMRS
jgi:NADH-quinone oxidoreductase subunit K